MTEQPEENWSVAAERNRLVAPRRFLAIHNPVAGRRYPGRLSGLVAELRAKGAAVEVHDTQARGDAERLAQTADAARFDVVVAAGGDGTIGEVVNGLMHRTQADLLLGIVPLGTVNVLAREIGLRDWRPAAVAEVLLSGIRQEIAVGRARWAGAELRHFVLMVGVGFDARVVAGVDAALKRRFGQGAYVWRSAVELWRYRRRLLRLRTSDGDVEAASLVIGNGRLYAGPYVIAPSGDLSRPQLSACLLLRPGRWQVLRYAMALFAGRLPRAKGYRIVTCTQLRVEAMADDGIEPVQIDGDHAGHLPLEIDLAPRRLALLTPRP